MMGNSKGSAQQWVKDFNKLVEKWRKDANCIYIEDSIADKLTFRESIEDIKPLKINWKFSERSLKDKHMLFLVNRIQKENRGINVLLTEDIEDVFYFYNYNVTVKTKVVDGESFRFFIDLDAVGGEEEKEDGK